MPDASLPFSSRLWFSFVCFFRVLFDGSFAARALLVRDAMPSSPAETPKSLPPEPKKEAPRARDDTSALTLLSILQTSGRFVDFLEEDVAGFSDADVGVAARVVHEGCRKAVREHLTLAAIRDEAEGAKVTIEKGYDASAIKLIGRVSGDGPWRGAIRHRGWRAAKLSLPTRVSGTDATILAPAEIEL